MRQHSTETRKRLSVAAKQQYVRALADGSEYERRKKISETMKRLRNSRKGQELWSESGSKISETRLSFSPEKKTRIYGDTKRNQAISVKRRQFLAANPEFKDAMVRRFMDAPKHKRSGPNLPERNVDSLGIEQLELTSSGEYFVSMLNGRHKNPDFVVRDFATQRRVRAVVEVMDFEFWHTRSEAASVRAAYKRQGIACKVIDAKRCYDQRSLRTVKREIERFIAELP